MQLPYYDSTDIDVLKRLSPVIGRTRIQFEPTCPWRGASLTQRLASYEQHGMIVQSSGAYKLTALGVEVLRRGLSFIWPAGFRYNPAHPQGPGLPLKMATRRMTEAYTLYQKLGSYSLAAEAMGTKKQNAHALVKEYLRRKGSGRAD